MVKAGYVCILLGSFFLVSTCFAKTAVIANLQSELPRLTIEQVKNYFLGEAVYSPRGERVFVADHPKNSKIRQVFYEQVAQMSMKEVSVHWAKKIFAGRGTPPVEIEGGDEKVKEWVKSKKNAVSYVEDRSVVDGTVKILLLVD